MAKRPADGERPAARDAAAEIDQRKFRAIAEPLDLRAIAREPYPIVEVRNPTRRTRYVTLWPAYPDRGPAFCTCTDFARRGLGDCKHVEAAWRWLRRPTPPGQEPALPPPVNPSALWAELERRLLVQAASEPKDIRALAEVGALLEQPPSEGYGSSGEKTE